MCFIAHSPQVSEFPGSAIERRPLLGRFAAIFGHSRGLLPPRRAVHAAGGAIAHAVGQNTVRPIHSFLYFFSIALLFHTVYAKPMAIAMWIRRKFGLQTLAAFAPCCLCAPAGSLHCLHWDLDATSDPSTQFGYCHSVGRRARRRGHRCQCPAPVSLKCRGPFAPGSMPAGNLAQTHGARSKGKAGAA